MSALALLLQLTALLPSGYGYVGEPRACVRVTPVLALDRSAVVSGNFRDTQGDCYVWLNARVVGVLRRAQRCKLILHELGHLAGLRHSANSRSVMFSPFLPAPAPRLCR